MIRLAAVQFERYVGVFVLVDGGTVEAVLDGVGVAGRCAVAYIQRTAAVRFAELGAFVGVVFCRIGRRPLWRSRGA
jgi:hypothetical protein